ncbi:extracellular matrix protein 1 [Sphaeramia orbicularis]|uniref:extracellular matrix protein 1 n=1 Tax=Sphaeramia orbicularis TaxID=375764 RepID=UPI001180AB25|nr:extracellular matrix protein 1-like [Sphaeramia orbicularis]
MISTGSLTGLWMMTLLTLHSADLGETRRNSLNEPDVPFPPACPTPQNLAAICHSSHGRPRYTASYFPRSGASHFIRRGKAINHLESWFSVCCSGQVAQQSDKILCCAVQAWKQALSQFCQEEYSTMSPAYECCQKSGNEKWICFNSDLPNPHYSPTPGYTAPTVPPQPGFTFNPQDC